LVLLKAGLVLLLAALGAINRYRNVPWAARRLRGLRRVGSAEVVAGTAALLTAAGLVNVSPPAYATVQPPAPQVTATGSDFATTVRLRLVVSPGTAGFNYFTLRITDYDSGSVVTADSVTLRFSLPSRSDIGESSLTLKRARDGTYQGTGTNLSLEGRWRVDAFILRGARSVQVTLNVTPIAQRQRIDVVRAPGQPTLYTIHLSQGRTLQVYLDPGKPGANEFHSTLFDASGNELPVSKATISMRPPGGKRAPLPLRELEPGHFVADATVVKGKSGFDIVGTTADGEVLAAHIDITLGQ
jgi:hypothetical protein